MSGYVAGWVLKHSPVRKLGHLVVLLVLADCAHDDGSGAYPSVETIAKRGRQTSRNVQYALRELESAGHIRALGKTRRGTTIWAVNLPQAGDEMVAGRNGFGVKPVSPEPSVEPSVDISGGSSDGLGANDDTAGRRAIAHWYSWVDAELVLTGYERDLAVDVAQFLSAARRDVTAESVREELERRGAVPTAGTPIGDEG